jgi:crotonobetainyl-CoA:carnitine CoA-transferase CaiB-like acyl-CoA transferase
MMLLDREQVPVGIVNTVDRVVADPQIRHREMIVELASEDGRRARVMGDPMVFQEAPRPRVTYPPASGEHTADVLSEVLGLDAAEIERLRRVGAVALRAVAETAP